MPGLSKEATCLPFKISNPTSLRSLYYTFKVQTVDRALLSNSRAHLWWVCFNKGQTSQACITLENILLNLLSGNSNINMTLSTHNYSTGQPDAPKGKRKLASTFWKWLSLALLCQKTRASLARRILLLICWESFWVWVSQKGLKILETTKKG